MTNQDKADLWEINPMTGARVQTAKEMLQESFGQCGQIKYERMSKRNQDILGELYTKEPLYQEIHACNTWRAAI